MRRSVLETMDKVLAVIPDGEEVKAELQDYRDSIFIELPEANIHIWIDAQRILHKYLKDREELWVGEVVAIWKGKQP